MLTVINYRGELFYVIGASFNSTDTKYLVGLSVNTGNFATLNQTYCDFQYFVDDKGNKLDLNFKRIKDKQ